MSKVRDPFPFRVSPSTESPTTCTVCGHSRSLWVDTRAGASPGKDVDKTLPSMVSVVSYHLERS